MTLRTPRDVAHELAIEAGCFPYPHDAANHTHSWLCDQITARLEEARAEGSLAMLPWDLGLTRDEAYRQAAPALVALGVGGEVLQEAAKRMGVGS